MIYLSYPYSSDDQVKRNSRLTRAAFAASSLIKNGYTVYNPLAESLCLIHYGMNNMQENQWIEYDKKVLKYCRCMVVLTMAGWAESYGVLAEVDAADEMGIPLFLVRPFSDEKLPEKLEEFLKGVYEE